MPRLRLINQKEAQKVKTEKQLEYDRQRNLELLFNLRPGVFDADDQIVHE